LHVGLYVTFRQCHVASTSSQL